MSNFKAPPISKADIVLPKTCGERSSVRLQAFAATLRALQGRPAGGLVAPGSGRLGLLTATGRLQRAEWPMHQGRCLGLRICLGKVQSQASRAKGPVSKPRLRLLKTITKRRQLKQEPSFHFCSRRMRRPCSTCSGAMQTTDPWE